MVKDGNIVHQYFKKQLEGVTILVKVNPILYKGSEITLTPDGKSTLRELQFDEGIFDDLKHDGFSEASPLEFNLYYSGLA
ncbi:MAG: hypothetical protein JNM57_05445 [Cyclobacteriaceae bacterium]|nr:hypothetical protein [Cyclobacteriaceae bacterium]